MTNQIDSPGLKDQLWHSLREDLARLVPWFADNDRLLCPACCRSLGYDDFSVEHILPQQMLSDDPEDVRRAIPRNERSGITLLCRRQLIVNGRAIQGAGCNGWKGKHYDRYLRELLQSDIARNGVNSRHQMAFAAAGYLGLFRRFGYQITLLAAGNLMRRQFFNPNRFLADFPTSCQIILMGEARREFSDDARAYWSNPFNVTIEGDSAAFVVVRNMGQRLPLSRDPTTPLASSLTYVPPRYAFRPDLRPTFS